MEDEITQDDFLKAFGIDTNNNQEQTQENQTQVQDNQANDNANPSVDPAQQNQTQGNADSTDGAVDSENGETNADNQGSTQPNTDNKAAQAFAAMRVELANKNRMLENVMNVLGLDPKAQNSSDQLQTKLNEALAKKQGIPVELLNRLNQLEANEQLRQTEQIRNNAYLGFQRIKSQFGLDDAQLQAFANELVADGKNPFTTQMDLITEYKLKNFDRLLEQAKSQGAQSEAERSAKAGANATTPSTTTGGTADTTPEQINTVKQLTDWFNQQGK